MECWQTNYNGSHFSHTKSMKKLLKTRKWALWDLLYFFVEAFSPIINIDWDIILQKFLVRYHRKFTPVFCMSLVKFCQQISTKNLVLGLKKKKKAINIIIDVSPCIQDEKNLFSPQAWRFLIFNRLRLRCFFFCKAAFIAIFEKN